MNSQITVENLKKFLKGKIETPTKAIYDLVCENHIPVVIARVFSEPGIPVFVHVELNGPGGEAVFGMDGFEDFNKSLKNDKRWISREVKTLISEDVLDVIEGLFPCFRIKDYYLGAGKSDCNILIPLLHADDKIIQQFLKHNLFVFANEFYKNDIFYQYREKEETVEEMFGLPIEVLMKMDKSVLGIEGVFETLAYINQNQPERIASVSLITKEVFLSWLDDMLFLLDLSPNIVHLSSGIRFYLLKKKKEKERHEYWVNGSKLVYYFSDDE